jgi:capsular polysaccharide biosynthesis protein
MKDFSEELEGELIGHWGGTKALPDREYFSKVLRRNLSLLIMGGVLTGMAVGLVPRYVDDSYRSSVYAVFDPSDTGSNVNPMIQQARAGTAARLFKARFESQEFLADVAAALGGEAVLAPENPFSLLIRKSSSEAMKKVDLARLLGRQLETIPEAEAGILGLTATSNSPELAQKMANEAMDLFIKRDLDEQIKNNDIQLGFLKKNVGQGQRANVKLDDSIAHSTQKRAERMLNDGKEKEFDERLRNLNQQLDSLKRERDQTLTAVKRDLVKLQTKLQANHPQVVEKRKEIDLITNQYKNSESKLEADIGGIRSSLWAVRNSQSRNLEPSDIDLTAVSSYRGDFYTQIADKLKELEMERKNLMQQKENPSLRTRIRILSPANYEPVPFKMISKSVSYVVFIIGCLATFAIVVLTELRNPLARDAWRIERITGKKIVAQISHRNTHELTNISPAMADQLRGHLSRIHQVDEASRTLMSYRRLELAIMQECKGDVVLLINAGAFDNSGQIIKNFLNIYATDHQDDYLLVDCNLQEPVHEFKSREGKPSMVEFWQGSANFEDVCINREQMPDFAFDVLPPMAKLSGEKTRVFRAENIVPAIDRIPYKYRKIFIRGMPSVNFIENRALLAAATDVFIIVDAQRSHYFDLHRTLVHMESEKIRGLVAVGT